MVNLKQGIAVLSMAGSLLYSAPLSADGSDAASPAVEQAAALFVITYRPGPSWKWGVPMDKQGLRDHFYYWKSLDESGKVAVAGPVGADGGLVLLRVGSQEEADAIIAQDPAFKEEIFVGDARPFVPRFVGKTPIIPLKP